jgi:hypothetical protein
MSDEGARIKAAKKAMEFCFVSTGAEANFKKAISAAIDTYLDERKRDGVKLTPRKHDMISWDSAGEPCPASSDEQDTWWMMWDVA